MPTKRRYALEKLNHRQDMYRRLSNPENAANLRFFGHALKIEKMCKNPKKLGEDDLSSATFGSLMCNKFNFKRLYVDAFLMDMAYNIAEYGKVPYPLFRDEEDDVVYFNSRDSFLLVAMMDDFVARFRSFK